MASLDKLVKALEGLKLTLTPSSSEEKLIRHKEKLSLCHTATDLLCSAEMRSVPNFPNLLSFSIETLLQMCDDKDSDIRMMADECLNRIIRANMSTMHNTILKIHVELHKEIKKNGKARSLRAALTRFSQLAHMIRPQKGKVYMQTLTPCLINIARRREESILETLAASVPKIFSALGSFASDNQIKSLLETLLENVTSDNAVVRRTSATCIIHVCISIPKSQVFLAFALSSLLDLVVPMREDTSSAVVLGVLNCVRGLLPHINYQERQSVIKGSFGTKRKHTSQAPPSLDYILQVFELCLQWSSCSLDHNVVSTSLETLQQVLSWAPSGLVNMLICNQGLVRSRIHPLVHPPPLPALTNRSLSEMSLSSSVGGGDESLLFELEEAPLVNLSTWLSDQHVDRTTLVRSDQQNISRPGWNTPSSSNLSLDSVAHDHLVPNILEESGISDGEKPLSPEPLEMVDSMSPPSSPQTSLPVIQKKWDVGELFDSECSALVYTARFLSAHFLLGGGSVRVSIRCLAVSCLTQLVRIQPSVVFSTLDRHVLNYQPGEVDRVIDVLKLSDHSDPQLRGLVRVMAGELLAASLQVCTQPSPDVLHILPRIITLLLEGLEDESSVCVRHTLSSISLFLKDLLKSDYHSLSLPLLEMLIKTSLNPYWLVKVKLLDIVSELPLTMIAYSVGGTSYQDKLISSILLPALAHSDTRVRKAVATSFVKLVDHLYYPADYQEADVLIALSSSIVENILTADPSRANNISSAKIQNNLSRIVFLLSHTIIQTTNKYTVLGCVETLCLLSNKFKVTDFPSAWQCSVNPSSTSNSIGNGDLLSLMISLLTTSSLSVDLECHTSLLSLAGNLFYGLSQSFLRHADTVFDPTSLWPNIKDPKVCGYGKTLLQHVLRLLCMLVRVMDDCPKTTGVSPLKRRPSRAQSPPSKTPQSPFLDKEKREEKKVCVGHFLNVPHCMKLYDLIRSAYNNYRVSLEVGSSEKLVRLVCSVLMCLGELLKPATITSSCSLTEEILSYLRAVFVLDSTHTVQVVNQLLRCLFVRKDVTKEAVEETMADLVSVGVFDILIGNPLKHLTLLLESNHPPPVAGEKESSEGSDSRQSAAITLDRTALALHIKLFEPIVIQALKEYTVTSNVLLQVEVLKLLMQLVMLKVNYCLLDSEQIFFKFVLKQFDFLETGQIQNAELLIPEIFHFLSHLSNEKNHSKPVISIPRVIQLCDGLMACGQDPLTHCIPALTPLVEHVFVSPSTTCDAKELDTQREVILAMLLKLAEYPQVVTLLKGVMRSGRRQTEQWKKLYTQTVDTLVEAMSRASIRLDRVHTLFSLLNSAPSPHLPHLLTLLFTPQIEEQAMDEWVGGLAAVLMSVSNCKEESVFLQLDQMHLYIQEEGDDPLNVNTKSKQLHPQQLMAKLLLKVVKNVSVEMEAIESSTSPTPPLLYTHFSDFIYTIIRIITSGGFEEVTKCLMELMKTSEEVEEITRCLNNVHRSNPLPIILWSYLLALLNIGSPQLWRTIIYQEPQHNTKSEIKSLKLAETSKRSINTELVRRASILLYCQYIAGREEEEKISDLEWLLDHHVREIIVNCYEPPVEKMLRSVYMSQAYSKLLLDRLSKCIVLDQAGFTYRLLHCLEFINPSHTGLVLKLVALSLIQHNNISIARLAVSFCSRTLEYLLTLEQDQMCYQLSKDQILALMDLFSTNSKLSKRGSVVTSLLNKLGHQMYGITGQEVITYSAKSIDVKQIQSTKLDSAWLASLVREKCCKGGDREGKLCANLLNKLTKAEIEGIMNNSNFNLTILQHCFLMPASLMQGGTSEEESNSFPDLYILARELLLSKLNYLKHKSESGEGVESDVILLVPAVSNYLSSLLNANSRAFPSNSHYLFHNFALLSVQVLKKTLSEVSGKEVTSQPTRISSLHECLALTLDFPCVTSLLDYKDISYICDVTLSTIKLLVHLDVPMKTLKASTEDMSEEDNKFTETCLKIASLTLWLETSGNCSRLMPAPLYTSIRKIILSLSVSSKVLYYCRVPVEAWPLPIKYGTVPPPIDINILHDVTLLRHLVNRISMLKWRSRQEFEETWVCLLSALVPSLDPNTLEQDDMFTIMQLNRLVVDAVSWLVLTTLRLESGQESYLHVPRLSSQPITSHGRWPRLKELNDLILSKFRTICQRLPLNLTRVDLRANLERFDRTTYGIGQLSVEYLQYQLLLPEERPDPPKSDIEKLYLERERRLVDSGLDVRSCVQFLLDLFSQWSLPNSSMSDSVDLTIIRSTLCLSDLFTEKNHYVWMMDKFLQVSKTYPQFDHIMHQYLTVGVCKAAAVLAIQEEEECDKVFRIVENALKSSFPPVRTSGVEGLLYLLQVTQPTKSMGSVGGGDPGGEGGADTSLLSHLQIQASSPSDYSNKIISLALEHINKHFLASTESEEEDCVWVLSLVMYVVECYPDSGLDILAVVKSLSQLIKNPPSQTIYHTAIQGMERLVLVSGRTQVSDTLGRLALERLSHSDPLITLPALQLLLASLYSDVKKSDDSSSMSWTMEKMETTSVLFERIKKGYLLEVELIVEIVAKVLSDLFPASDILTKVIGEFLSPNQPHKRHMARILLQCFSQACEEDQLSLLQDWVVHFLNNFSANLPTAAWCLSCFFISASTNPNLKAIFPVVQRRITQCDIEDRKILCLAALDFYRQLSVKQQETLLVTMRETAPSQKGPFADIISCL